MDYMNIDKIFGNRLVAYRHAYENRFVEPLPSGHALAPGAHIVTPWFGFAHHGIYVGEGKVVHYGALVYDIIRRPVEEVTLDSFTGGRPLFVVKHAEGVFEAERVIRRARSRIGESRYRLMSMNCEHFAEWCLHGEHRSFQVESALDFPHRAAAWWRANVQRLISRLTPSGVLRRPGDCDARARRTRPGTMAD
jgi:hypothetical protein